MKFVKTAIVLFCLALTAVLPAIAQPREKHLIEYGWDVPYPSQMAAMKSSLESSPFDGIIYRLAGGYNAFGKAELTPDKFAADIRTLGSLHLKQVTHNFVLIWGTAEPGWDWFDDGQWAMVLNNAKQLARAAKASGSKGICFDPEPYDVNPWKYSSQLHANTITYPRYRARVKACGAEFMRALESEIPGPELLTFFHLSLFTRMLDEPNLTAVEDRLKRENWGLMADFLIGMLQGASQIARFIDGNEMSYYYQGSEPFFKAYQSIHSRALSLVPPELRAKYTRQVEAGQALYVDRLFGLTSPTYDAYLAARLTTAERAEWCHHNTYYALYTSDDYVWCYSEHMSWWDRKNNIPPGLDQALRSAVLQIKAGQPLGYQIEPTIQEALKRPRPAAAK